MLLLHFLSDIFYCLICIALEHLLQIYLHYNNRLTSEIGLTSWRLCVSLTWLLSCHYFICLPFSLHTDLTLNFHYLYDQVSPFGHPRNLFLMLVVLLLFLCNICCGLVCIEVEHVLHIFALRDAHLVVLSSHH